jgi:hypothetical protein
MARSPELIDTVVATTGETKASVSVTLSRLRKAALVPVGGRGPYAIAMDTQSAVRLLIAVCGAVTLEADSAVNAVHRFEGLLSHPAKVEHGKLEAGHTSIIMPLDDLPEEHILGMALKHLIEASGREELFTFVDRTNGVRQRAYTNPGIRGFLRLHFMLPIPQVRIEHQFAGWFRKTWIYGEPIELERYNAACRDAGMGDRTRITTISETTIEAIGRVLRQ